MAIPLGPLSSALSGHSGPLPSALSGRSGPLPSALSGRSGPLPPALSGRSGPLPPALSGRSGPVALLLPVKAFAESKLRLATALAPNERAELARAMATHVLSSTPDVLRAVVCDDIAVAEWARGQGALVVWEPEKGLNRAVEAGVARLGQAGADRVIVAHADLPWASDLRWVARFDGITIVPDNKGGGTNVICVPTAIAFSFSYGPGSFSRHAAETHRLQVPLRVVREASLGHDVDLPSDLSAYAASR